MNLHLYKHTHVRYNGFALYFQVTFASVGSAAIEKATCSCPIGQTGACGHVVGLLYQLAKYKMLETRALPEDIAKTSLPQSWHEPRGERIQGKAVQDLTVSGHSKMASSSTPRDVRSTLYNPVRGDSVNWKDHVDELQSSVKDMLIIPALKLVNVENVTCKFGQVPKGSVLSYQQRLEENCVINLFDETSFPELPQQNFMCNNYNTILENEKQVMLDSLKLSKTEISKFETQTRLQSQSPLWYRIRKHRLTASNIGEIFKRRKENKTLVERLKSTRHVTTAAMRQGIASEPFAASEYAKCLNNQVNLYACGVVVNYWAPWLAATPDRKVYNPRMVPMFGLLEIKCPQVSSVLEAKYLLKDETGQLKLKRNHSYYYQVLTQMAVTGLEWCDFFVWCPSDYHKETIYFNEVIWVSVKEKVDMFYFNDFL